MATDNAFKKEVADMKMSLQQLWEDPSFPVGQTMFGFSAMKKEQIDLLAHCLLKTNVFGILPTGFGKSFVYMALPFFAEKLARPEMMEGNCCVLVVSPLKSLIDNQYKVMRSHGLTDCVALHEDSLKFKDALKSTSRVVLATPEYLLSEKGKCLLSSDSFRKRLVTIVFDEAHVISDWGSSFRKAYKDIANLRVRLQKSVLLLTATCSKENYKDITTWFAFGSNIHHIAVVPNRPNIYLSLEGHNAIGLRESLLWLAEELKIEKHHTPKTLIYVKDIQQINDLKILFGEVCGDLLFHPDYPKSISTSLVQAYYAKAGKATKEKVFNDFSPKEDSRVRIVICTIAFGLGIDVSDIRRVIHWGAPKNAAAYLQEVGRAGRDGKYAEAYMYVVPSLLRDESSDVEFNKVLREFCEIKRSKKLLVNKRSRATQTSGDGHVEQFVAQPTDTDDISESQQCWRNYLLQQVYLPFMDGSIPEITPCTSLKSSCERHKCCSLCRKSCQCNNSAQVASDEASSVPPARLGPLETPSHEATARRSVDSMYDDDFDLDMSSFGLHRGTSDEASSVPPARLGPLETPSHEATARRSVDSMYEDDFDLDMSSFGLHRGTSDEASSVPPARLGPLETPSHEATARRAARGRGRGAPRKS